MKKDISYVLWGLFWIAIGLGLMVRREPFVDSMVYITGVSIFLLGLFKFPEALFATKKFPQLKHKLFHWGEGLLHLLIASLIVFISPYSAVWLARLVGLYQMVLGLIALVNYLILRSDRVPRRLNQLMIAFYNLFFGLLSLFNQYDVQGTLFRLGIYLIFVGLTSINDGRRILISQERETRFNRKIRISVPVIFTMFLPHGMMTKINAFINDELDLTPQIEADEALKARKNVPGIPDLKVFIHTAKTGFNTVGHCDISYQGRIYTFGNYDVDSERLFGTMGDGVLVETNETSYIDYCLREADKTLFEYQLVLDPQQRQAFEAKLADIKQLTVPWEPTSETQKASYMGQLQVIHGASFSKFKTSRFKTYFVLGTNCVLLADELIGTAGLDLIRMAGIIAPGSYFDYLEKEYENPNSIVVGMAVHSSEIRALQEKTRKTFT
ncbi:HdeD family acid-resistance protein [Streptococcus moroccensis]|uniref:Membrane channel-forming protein YqfA (Hemolysin III family) n=1 Tax=Streptococcus moroccensis TaxID=1451356 RepID=A0ABT9YR65_9STRE|nr:DUF308 domain-containing protein [Streptococcus moroccensis]MDQ0222492.1 putative membrane channel-forming protein YqfA (hemolysin III family) [Streptococcus moroccensis]